MKKTTEKKTTKEQERTFPELLEAFSKAWEDGAENSAELLQELATACACSVLKRVADPRGGANSMRKDMEKKTQETDPRKRQTPTNSGCNPYIASFRRDVQRGVKNTPNATIGDGYDMVNDAVEAILTEVEKQRERGERVNMTAPYTVRRLNKRVWIKEQESPAWVTVETTPIEEVYAHVRRKIDSSRAVQVNPRKAYDYFEDVIFDDETGEKGTIYKRGYRWQELSTATDGKTRYDADGAPRAWGARGEYVSSAVGERMEQLTDRLVKHLTPAQKEVLVYRLRGFGDKAIATRLNVKPDSIRDRRKAIAKKAIDIGMVVKRK